MDKENTKEYLHDNINTKHISTGLYADSSYREGLYGNILCLGDIVRYSLYDEEKDTIKWVNGVICQVNQNHKYYGLYYMHTTKDEMIFLTSVNDRLQIIGNIDTDLNILMENNKNYL